MSVKKKNCTLNKERFFMSFSLQEIHVRSRWGRKTFVSFMIVIFITFYSHLVNSKLMCLWSIRGWKLLCHERIQASDDWSKVKRKTISFHHRINIQGKIESWKIVDSLVSLIFQVEELWSFLHTFTVDKRWGFLVSYLI